MKNVASSVRLSVLTAILVLQGCGPEEGTQKPPPAPAELVVKVSADKSSLRVNETVQLEVRGEKGSEQAELGTVTYSTSDKTIADVDPSTGLVTAKGTGTATITATAQGKSGTLPLKVEGGAIHSGLITKSETWRVKDNPHYVQNSVEVEGTSNPTLTLEPGVIVRFAANTGLFVGDGEPGTLKAEGTAQDPIQFVADAASPIKGHWQGVMLGMQGGTASVVRHAKFSHCGGAYPFPSSQPCLMASGARPVFADISIQSSAGSGLEVCDGAWLLDGSARLSVSDSAYGIIVGPNFAHTVPADATVNNNTINAVVLIPGEKVTESQTWPILKDATGKNVPYLVMREGFTIGGPNSPTLTLKPGTEVRFMKDTFLEVGNDDGPGGLIAEGTSTAPIVFTSHAASPAKGAWIGFVFNENRLTTTSLKHAVVDFAGGSNALGSNMAGISVVGDTNGAFIQNVTVRNSAACGFRRDTTDTHPAFNTDFTAAEFGNTFSNNTGADQCGP